ncbi:MAG: serine/threonine-protein phosphatase [Nannocystaceae bacterium]|nr:serine/threonine-protein phosphatase [Nannocystaceae bacterium]
MSDPPDGNKDGPKLTPERNATVRVSRHQTLKLLSSAGPFGFRSLADASIIAGDPGVSAETAGRTDIGRVRENNQDQFLIASLERSLLVEDSSFPAEAGTRLSDTPQGRLFIVADGIGGHGGGEVASAVAIDAMAHYAFAMMPWVLRRGIQDVEALVAGLEQALRDAQARLRRVAKRKNLPEKLGTTLTMAYVRWPDAVVLHVGDSRAYLHRGDDMVRLTKDHTLAERLVESHAMSREEAERSHFSHVLVNAVGGGSDALEVEVHKIVLQPNDTLLLCSDGLSGYVDEAAIAAKISSNSSVRDIVNDLIALANNAGGGNNITAVVARF